MLNVTFGLSVIYIWLHFYPKYSRVKGYPYTNKLVLAKKEKCYIQKMPSARLVCCIPAQQAILLCSRKCPAKKQARSAFGFRDWPVS